MARHLHRRCHGRNDKIVAVSVYDPAFQTTRAVRYVDHIEQRGSDFYRVASKRDLEGIVAKWRRGTYRSDGATSWLKIKNPDYSVERHAIFDKRRSRADRTRWTEPELVLV